MFANVIFDLYGTLADIHTDEEKTELWEEMAEWYGRFGAAYTPRKLRERYFSVISRMERSAGDAHEGHSEIDIGVVFRELFGQVRVSSGDIKRTARRFRELSTDYLRLYPYASELLGELRAAGKGVWLLTNAQSLFTVPELDALGIARYFDGIYISSDWGVKKPDLRFFRRLLDERRIDPESAVMVGNDGTADIQGARAVGMRTVYVRSNISPAEPTPEADFVFETMDLRGVGEVLLR